MEQCAMIMKNWERRNRSANSYCINYLSRPTCHYNNNKIYI